MNQPPLNPDALEAAASVLCDETAGQHTRYADLKTGLAKKLWGQRAEHVVSAYLAAVLPEVTSVEELDQLPDDTVALDDAGAVLRKWTANEWYATGDDQSYMNTEIGLPARVLYRPEVKP